MRTGSLVGALVVSSMLSVAGCAYPKHTEMVELPNAVVPPHAVAPPAPPACAGAGAGAGDDKAEARAAAAELVADIARVVLTAVLH